MFYIPDRVWRCILELTGRTLRQQADRKRIFDLLRPMMPRRPKASSRSQDALRAVVDQCSESISADGSFERFSYLLNVSEQIANFYDRNERLPESYYDMQAAPGGSPFITFAGDDGGEKGRGVPLTDRRRWAGLPLQIPSDRDATLRARLELAFGRNDPLSLKS